jgi:deoxyribodipyrimidine photo-lyase
VPKASVTIFWFRRDLRLWDNAALWMALKSDSAVLPIFIFDRDILDQLKNKKDARVSFIHQEISRLKNELEKLGSSLKILYGKPKEVFEKLLNDYEVKAVFANRDYEPYAQNRDKEIYDLLKTRGVDFKGAKDHVIFEKDEILKDNKKPYTVFTPYANKWKKVVTDFYLKSYPSENYQKNFWRCPPFSQPTLAEIGFKDFNFAFFPERKINLEIISQYALNRDFPAIKGTSRLSLHLRFGTVSIRQLCRIAIIQSEKWLDELIWRDFYQMIIYHFPHSAVESFKAGYDQIAWNNDLQDFQKWCEGKTGYPIVDAGMRELNETGFMHNRVRMIVASFLCKHLLIDWRWGEKYFAEKLLDYELASNVGGWQWVVGSGCDGAPYFRIFNPESQAERFDPEKKYIKKWVLEFGTKEYCQPMIDHKIARIRCLESFKRGLEKATTKKNYL